MNAKIVETINTADSDLSIATMLITRIEMADVITSYSIHYTKLYDDMSNATPVDLIGQIGLGSAISAETGWSYVKDSTLTYNRNNFV